MLQTIENVNAVVNNFVWGVPAMVCIIGVGLVLSARTGFIQFRKFGYALKNSIGRIFTKSEAKEGSITPFQAVCTALAATVGTGNIAGVAGAIAIGGAGAVFWMWVSALLGMCTKFSEVTLAVHYREKNAEGDYVGGPMYYIKNGLGKKWYWMASVYAILGSLTVLGTGNATQVNTITTSIDSALISYNVIDDAQVGMVNLVIGIVIAALVAVVLLGGVKRIGTVTEKLVPFMAVFYIILAIGVVVLNADRVPHVFEMIFVGAFNPSAFTGGVVGSMFMTMRRGVSRGIFSNEAGIGTGSIAHACADTEEPVKQGMFGIFEVFADTIVICTLTALVILCGGEGIQYGVAAGAELTISGFVTTYGSWVTIFTAIAVFEYETGIKFPLLNIMVEPDASGAIPLESGLLTCGQISCVLIGAFPMVEWITRTFGKPLESIGGKLGMNKEGSAGLVANLANNIAVFNIMGDMNPKAKLLNVAFAVSAAFVFGDYLGFTAGVNSEMIFPMIVGKLTAGITALIVANILAPKLLSKVEASVKAAEKEE